MSVLSDFKIIFQVSFYYSFPLLNIIIITIIIFNSY